MTFDPVSMLIGAAGTLVSVLGLTWAMLRALGHRDPFGKGGADEG